MSHNPFQNTGQAYYGNPALLQNQSSPLSQAQAASQLQAFNAALSARQHQWMINGQTMTIKEFADTLWPEDTAEKTFFYLKYSKE